MSAYSGSGVIFTAMYDEVAKLAREMNFRTDANDKKVIAATDKIAAELERMLQDEAYKKNMLAEYEHIRSELGSHPAAATAAAIITAKNKS